MRVSVVICTLNRARSLVATLNSLRHQSRHEFEVVVVNGPSTDDTDAVLAGWEGRIRVDRCPLPNLSMSRNIGIRAAAGEIVAFIDDDALPEFDWLAQSIAGFGGDEEVAGVGGIVFDHTGLDLQYRYSAVNRFAEVAVSHERPFDDQCFPGSFQVPYLQGTNALFRRSALLQIGGFDETFDYYLDETDLCCRLIDAGYRLRQLSDAPVHHKFLPSSVRDHQRVITNWYPIVKNHVYFSYRHARDAFSEYDVHVRADAFMSSRVEDARHHEAVGCLPAGGARSAEEACAEGFRVGARLGHERRDVRLGPVTWVPPSFLPFATIATGEHVERRKITFVSSSYAPHLSGGIARFISDLAPALARRGHEVRVVTRAVDHPAVDLEEGVWVHRIGVASAGQTGVAPEALAHINDFTTAAVAEIARIAQWSHHDMIYGPLWDVEVLGALRRTGLPIAVQVATPLAIAAEMAGLVADEASSAAIAALLGLENEILAGGDLFHANSSAVAGTIEEHYPAIIEPDRWQVVHLGLADRRSPRPEPKRERVVLFVGRFEVRKGIDTFLEAVEQLAPEYPDVRFVAVGEDRPLSGGGTPYGATWLNERSGEPWFGRVRFEGAVTDERIQELYSQAELLVMPSRYESFGLVLVEGMVHGLPIISCDTSGIRDVVRNGVDGVLVTPGNSVELASAVRSMLDDLSLRASFGEAARSRFVDAFHIDAFAERFETFMNLVRFRDASFCTTDAGGPAPTRRSLYGYRESVLAAGDSVTFTLSQGVSSRLVLDAIESSTVVMRDARTRVLPLTPGTVARLPVSGGSTRLTLSVAHGTVAVCGLSEVLGASSPGESAHLFE